MQRCFPSFYFYFFFFFYLSASFYQIYSLLTCFFFRLFFDRSNIFLDFLLHYLFLKLWHSSGSTSGRDHWYHFSMPSLQCGQSMDLEILLLHGCSSRRRLCSLSNVCDHLHRSIRRRTCTTRTSRFDGKNHRWHGARTALHCLYLCRDDILLCGSSASRDVFRHDARDLCQHLLSPSDWILDLYIHGGYSYLQSLLLGERSYQLG